jgi:hypothetical protein
MSPDAWRADGVASFCLVREMNGAIGELPWWQVCVGGIGGASAEYCVLLLSRICKLRKRNVTALRVLHPFELREMNGTRWVLHPSELRKMNGTAVRVLHPFAQCGEEK